MIVKGVLHRIVGRNEGREYGQKNKDAYDNEPRHTCSVLEQLLQLVEEGVARFGVSESVEEFDHNGAYFTEILGFMIA